MRIFWPLTIVLALGFAASPVCAQDWLELETERFTVISQLNERDTVQWAEEFGRFVDALHGLMPVNASLLPPLTAVLFKRAGGFSPYRIRTESGVVGGNTAVFINYSTWSMIGMSGVRGASTDYSTLYHEAVHWYMSADPSSSPLWFREGIAEVFSSFEIERGEAIWGRSIPSNTSFLQRNGLQPLREFLEVTQDEAMHVNATYYSQAWLFVHYLIFNRLEEGVEMLSPFLRNLETMEPAEAFLAAFDMDFEEMDRLLRDYVDQTRFNVARSAIDDSNDVQLSVHPASDELVEVSLARLAFGTGNDETLAEHFDRLAEIAPESPAAYDLIAADMLSDRSANSDSEIEAVLDQAISLGSTDARTYELKAALRAAAVTRSGPEFSPDAMDPDEARRIANLLVSSLNLHPMNRRLYGALASLLFVVDETHEYDRLALDNGAFLFPREGIVLIGQAALAIAEDDDAEALRLIDLALSGDYNLSARDLAAARSLRERLAG